jgi:hypothetical protein
MTIPLIPTRLIGIRACICCGAPFSIRSRIAEILLFVCSPECAKELKRPLNWKFYAEERPKPLRRMTRSEFGAAWEECSAKTLGRPKPWGGYRQGHFRVVECECGKFDCRGWVISPTGWHGPKQDGRWARRHVKESVRT